MEYSHTHTHTHTRVFFLPLDSNTSPARVHTLWPVLLCYICISSQPAESDATASSGEVVSQKGNTTHKRIDTLKNKHIIVHIHIVLWSKSISVSLCCCCCFYFSLIFLSLSWKRGESRLLLSVTFHRSCWLRSPPFLNIRALNNTCDSWKSTWMWMSVLMSCISTMLELVSITIHVYFPRLLWRNPLGSDCRRAPMTRPPALCIGGSPDSGCEPCARSSMRARCSMEHSGTRGNASGDYQGSSCCHWSCVGNTTTCPLLLISVPLSWPPSWSSTACKYVSAQALSAAQRTDEASASQFS